MRYIRVGICKGYIRRPVFNQKSINQSACTNAKIEMGRGGKSVFSPNKDIGTRVGDKLGTGKYCSTMS